MFPKCSRCGRDPDKDHAMMLQTLYNQWVCSPCVYKDAKEVLIREFTEKRRIG